MEPWDISKAKAARNAGLRHTRRVCLFHDNDQENEALGSGQLSAVCLTDVVLCEYYCLLKASIGHTGRWLSTNFYKPPVPLASRIISKPLVDMKIAYFTADCEGKC